MKNEQIDILDIAATALFRAREHRMSCLQSSLTAAKCLLKANVELELAEHDYDAAKTFAFALDLHENRIECTRIEDA